LPGGAFMWIITASPLILHSADQHGGRVRHRDIAVYPRKLKLILTGFSEAAMAAHAIYPLVFPGKELHFVYSTAKGTP